MSIRRRIGPGRDAGVGGKPFANLVAPFVVRRAGKPTAAFAPEGQRIRDRLGPLAPAQQRRFAASSLGVLLQKTFQLGGEVHTAMLARGFRGDLRLLDDPRLSGSGWLQLVALLALSSFIIWVGR